MKPTSKLETMRKKYARTKEQFANVLIAGMTKSMSRAPVRVSEHVAPLKGMTTRFATSIRNLLSR